MRDMILCRRWSAKTVPGKVKVLLSAELVGENEFFSTILPNQVPLTTVSNPVDALKLEKETNKRQEAEELLGQTRNELGERVQEWAAERCKLNTQFQQETEQRKQTEEILNRTSRELEEQIQTRQAEQVKNKTQLQLIMI